MEDRQASNLVTVTFNNLMLTLPVGCEMHQELSSGEVWEPRVTETLEAELSSDMVFVDAGAQFGYYTLMVSKRCKFVYAFEPRVKQYTILMYNVTQNNCHNIWPATLPLFSESCLVNLREIGVALPLNTKTKMNEHTEAISRAVTLDDFLMGAKVDCIKIDVEGAEYDVLLGAKRTLFHHSPALVIEVHIDRLKWFQRSEAQLLQLLRDFGYDWLSLDSRHIIARKTQ